MRYLTILSNFVLLGVTVWWVTDEGFPSLGDIDCWLVYPMLTTALLNLPYLFKYKKGNRLIKPREENWLELYLKRKKLEEIQRIEQLSKSDK